MKIAKFRAGEGTELDIARSVYARIEAGETVTQSLIDELSARALARYAGHILAAMRREGFPLGDGEPVTLNVLVTAINERTGLNVQSLTPEGIAGAVDGLMAAKLGAALGVEVSTVLDAAQLKADILAGVSLSVQSGRASELVPADTIEAVRRAATWTRAGIGEVERVKILRRWYQKKFRKTHKSEWR